MDTPVEITSERRQALEQFLASPGPTILEARSESAYRDGMERFSVKTQLSIVIETRIGKPWVLGLHHCACYHEFGDQEVMIFNELANRLAEALNSMLALQIRSYASVVMGL